MLKAAGIATLIAALFIATAGQRGATARAVPLQHLAIDADLSNGVCDPVDPQAVVVKGAMFQVAVCLLDAPEAAEAITVHVGYDSKMVVPPEIPDAGGGLDDNPDANAGVTTFGSQTLGVGWDCTTFGVSWPVADAPLVPGSDALINCNGDLRNPLNTLHNGALVVITFQARKRGESRVRLLPDTSYSTESFHDYNCEGGWEPIRCEGAAIEISKPENAHHRS